MKQIVLSGIIGWDATANDLRVGLGQANGEDVELVISSPGGLVSDALEMFNLVRNYPGKTTARLSGFAMSAASYIPLAADRIVAEDNAVYMIHNVQGGVFGDHNDILRYGEFLSGLSGLISRAYAKKTGLDLGKISQMMDAETYFFGQEMVDSGFVDELIDSGSSDNPEDSKVSARASFGACMAKLSSDREVMKNDLTKAAALAGVTIKPRAQAKAEPADKGAKGMTLEQLKKEHPELVAAIEAEARKGMHTAEELATAKTDGAVAEQQRIKGVRAQCVPGHESLIEQMSFDGKSTAADAALAIVAAEQKKSASAAADLEADANKPVVPLAPDAEGGKTMKRKAFDALNQADRRVFLSGGGKLID